MFPSIVRSVPMLSAVLWLPQAFAADAIPAVELHKEGVQLIRRVEEVGREVASHADRLHSFNRGFHVGRRSHIEHLAQIRSLVNDQLRPAMERLAAIENSLPEWKQQSITMMMTAARALAGDADSAIMSKRERLTVPATMNDDYKAYVKGIFDHAEALVKKADAAATYATARLTAAKNGIPVPRT
jgi:hypothetical protein